MLKGSLRLGSLAGIPLYVHWTFALLIGWLVFIALRQGGPHPWVSAAWNVGFVGAIFGCVVLHELGHALAARKYGVPTRDITLLPIGGVARLERMPENPAQELVVAIAGPLVNVVIAGVLMGVIVATGGLASMTGEVSIPQSGGEFVVVLAVANIALVLFNLLPAFPMDGGRMLRAVLAMLMDRTRATQIAARIGQFMALGFGIFGLLSGNFLLLFIAVFVWLGAGAEAAAEQQRSMMRGLRVGQAMASRFRSLRASDTLQTAARELLAGHQEDFFVLGDQARGDDDAEALVGVLTRQDLVRGLAGPGRDAPVSLVMRKPCPTAREGDDLQTLMVRQETSDQGGGRPWPVVAVVRREAGLDGAAGMTRIVGIVTPENVMELMMVRSASGLRPAPAHTIVPTQR